MNPYTTRTRARIQPGDIARATLTDPCTAAISLAMLERTRTYQAETEVAWLLKENCVTPASVASRLAMLRQTIERALVRAGQRLGHVSGHDVSLKAAPVAGTLGQAD